VETQNSTSSTTSEIDGKKCIKEQFMSSRIFHQTTGGRVRENTVEEQFKPRTLKSFNLVTQESYQTSPASTLSKSEKINSFEQQPWQTVETAVKNTKLEERNTARRKEGAEGLWLRLEEIVRK
jgi:hypothetical protein